MDRILISVIVPVYGAEKYLDKCAGSILSQSYTELELILVDDGSKDLGGQMCDAWAGRDSRVRVLHKENGGLLYFTDVYGKPVQEYWHNMKFWWPHDEALIAMTLAYKLTGEERYAICHDMVHNWAFSHFQDVQHGDWFGYLNKDGSRANTLKGSLWKSFFHHPRAMWFCAHYCGAV